MTKEEVAEIVHGMPSGMDADDYLVELVSRAVAIEREACALLCDEVANKHHKQHYPDLEAVADECAGAIRANRSLVTTSAGKPNYCTPQVTPQVTPEVTGGVDETAKGEHKREWVGIEPQEIGQIWAKHKEVYGFGIELEQVLKERNT